MKALLARLLRAREGSVAIEFALIGPALIAMMFAVLQVGVGMQSYNALRSVSTDIARYAVVNYQTNNQLTDTQIETFGRSLATRAPYGLKTERLQIQVIPVGTSRVPGTAERTLQVTYAVPSFLSILGLGELPISYSQPIFLPNS